MKSATNFFKRGEEVLTEFSLWFGEELRFGIPSSALKVILIPAILIIPGAFLGVVSFTFKAWVIVPSLIFLWGYLAFAVLPRRAAVGTLIAVTRHGLRKGDVTSTEVTQGVGDYFRFLAAIISSELAVGTMALILPVHQKPLFGFITLFAGLYLVTYYIWKGTGEWWSRVVSSIGWLTLIVSLIAVLMPDIFDASLELASPIQGDVARSLLKVPLFAAFCFSFLLFFAAGTVGGWCSKETGPKVRRTMRTVALLPWIPVLAWLFHFKHLQQSGGSAEASTRPAIVDARTYVPRCPAGPIFSGQLIARVLTTEYTPEEFYENFVPRGCWAWLYFKVREDGWSDKIPVWGGDKIEVDPKGSLHHVKVRWEGDREVEGCIYPTGWPGKILVGDGCPHPGFPEEALATRRFEALGDFRFIAFKKKAGDRFMVKSQNNHVLAKPQLG